MSGNSYSIISTSVNSASAAFKDSFRIASDQASKLKQSETLTVQAELDSEDDTKTPIMSSFSGAIDCDSTQKMINFTVFKA